MKQEVQLLKIEARNFRAYDNLHLPNNPGGLTLVTGPNNTGKSSLLNVLDVVAMVPSETYFGRYGTQPEVRVRFSLSFRERVEAFHGVNVVAEEDAEKLLAKSDLEWVEWAFAGHDGKMVPIEIRTYLHGQERSIAKVLQDGSRFKILAPSMVLSHWDGTPNTTAGFDLETAILALSTPIVLDPLAKLLEFFLEWRRGYFHFEPLRRSRAREVSLASHERLESDGQNLAEVLLHLQHNEPEAWRHLGELLERIVPNVGQLMTPTSQGMFHVAFREKWVGGNFSHNLKDVGTGVEQVLLTLVAGLTSAAHTLVLEEPETGLHPAAQRALLSVIQDWARQGRNFFISTHSTVFLDWASSNILEVRKEGAASKVQLVSTNREKVLHALGVRLSDALSAERLLVLEGKSDELIIEQWFPHLIGDPTVAIIRGEGGDSARHVDILSKWLEQADPVGLRKVLYIRDRDELPHRLVEKLNAKDSAFLLPCREIENLLVDFVALSAHLEDCGAQRKLSPSEIETYARTVADSLQQVVVMKRTSWDLEPLRFVDNSSRNKMAKANFSREEMIARTVSQIPDKMEFADFVRTRWNENEGQIRELWERDWRILAPGYELLNSIYRRYLDRSYDKIADGPKLAAKVTPIPELVRIVESFVR
ncbi:AAA family ATPase [Streptomyces sp. BH-SS-21]|uniref:AAA family ATPase n=1 Tax=Streptomyces liliiviolaceus TaxID=2823109 RepID=A0A941B4A4_9ACTN|nr:AAA family ATPase [Streptomyces liliiviolaceus]MBQ0850135.1 AAA family ATPase [Streptomyces liliiviolaceus]